MFQLWCSRPWLQSDSIDSSTKTGATRSKLYAIKNHVNPTKSRYFYVCAVLVNVWRMQYRLIFIFQVAQMTKDKRGSTREAERSQAKQDFGKPSISSSSLSVNAPFNVRGDRKAVLI